MIRRLRGLASDRRDARLAPLEARIEDIATFLQEERDARERAAVDTIAALDALRALLENEVQPVLATLARDDAHNRRGLYALRATPEYELAFTEPDPLVTVAVATAPDRLELLRDRALPSALDQTYPHIEVVVVGDAAGDATRTAVEALGDERIRFCDLTQRAVHPEGARHWLTAATVPRNEAHRLARGRWIADLDDDDALRPTAVESLLALAREHRLEVAYGIKVRHTPSGESGLIGAFPPAPLAPDWRERGLPFQPWDGAASCGALTHAGLTMFAREHIAADLGRPGDFFLLDRMVRAGVRFGMLDEVVYDYYPSKLWLPDA